jgi:hypothetical protein
MPIAHSPRQGLEAPPLVIVSVGLPPPARRATGASIHVYSEIFKPYRRV